GGGAAGDGGGVVDVADPWWEPGSGGSDGQAPAMMPAPAPIPPDEVPGYYDVLLGGTTRPTRQPTRRPTNKPSMSAEQAMHRYSFCGAFWTDARDNCVYKAHCEDDRDCPANEFCWTQTPCDHYATNPPTTPFPTDVPSPNPTAPAPTRRPTGSPIGTTPTKSPTPEPTIEPTFSPTFVPTNEPTVTKKPTDKPTYDANDPSLTFFCGTSWAHADESCGMRCPSGNSADCPAEFECWAFTSCSEERGIQTSRPTELPTPAPFAIYVPGPGGGRVPVFGGIDYSKYQPTISPAPTESAAPTIEPTLPPGVVAKELLATYYCGVDWNDVETNCHQPCPSGYSDECSDPSHSCWAFVHSCKARAPPEPTAAPPTSEEDKPTPSPATRSPTRRDPDAPASEPATDPPTDLYGLLEGQKGKFHCAAAWDGIVCGVSASCPSGDDNDCPEGESCFSSLIDCSEPQPRPTERPTRTPDPPTRSPEAAAVVSLPQPQPESAGNPSQDVDVNNEGETWGTQQQQTGGEGDGQSQQIDNEGETWDADGPPGIDNEGETWGSGQGSGGGVDNSGEDWNDGAPKPPTPATDPPTDRPTPPREPTPDPTPEPTVDLATHLQNLKESYFCSDSWDDIDCANAKACPSGDSKDCPKKQECYSGTPCKVEKPEERPTGGKPASPGASPSPTVWTPLSGDKEDAADVASEAADYDEVTSKFFCGSSWGELVADCERAEPCPSGTNAECEGGQSCFANTPCGKAPPPPKAEADPDVGIFNFAAMVEKVPAYCQDEGTMSHNVGYWQSWSIYREEDCNPFTAKSIDASSYTHVVFSFASISSSGTLEPWDFEADIKGGQYREFMELRDKYPGTKIMIAAGGWTHNEPDNERLYRFSNSAATPKSRMKFAQSSVAFMRKYGFDGLDIDWEYPGDETRGGNATLDKENLVLLCDELRKYFDGAPEKFELSIAMPASVPRFEAGFDLTKLAESVHIFNVMAYDLHGVWDEPPIVGAHSDIGGINEAIEYMITNSSVPPSQIVMGMPAYGRSYTMANETCLALGCPFDEFSNETATGGCLDTNGFVPFVEIYDWEQRGQGKGYDSVTVDLATYSAIMVKDEDQLISYDNVESFKAKVDYASNKCLGGTMVWAIDMLPIGTQSAGSGQSANLVSSLSGSEAADGSSESILTEEQSNQAFCGKDWDDAISTCSRSCPSGTSDDCEGGETCFAGTPCGEGGVLAVGDTCKICPDTTSQGVLSWIEIEVDIDGDTTSTTCGDLDYGLLLSVSKDSETCDAMKLDFSHKCCYQYPEVVCNLCRKGLVYYNVRSDLDVTMPDGTEASCGLVNKMLAPEENDGENCVTTQDALFDLCCYEQCSLCEGQGIKWWIEFEESRDRRLDEVGGDAEEENVSGEENAEGEGEEEEEINSCSSIDASLYSDFIEAETDQCREIKSKYSSECCYTFPTTPCGLCNKDGTVQTLLWAQEAEFEGRSVSCGIIDNMLNTDEEGSPDCLAAKDEHFSSCCFDKCSLCDGAQLAWDFVVDFDEETQKTCGDIEAIFAAEEVNSDSDACIAVKDDFQELCCFTPPVTPCQLCPEYVRWDETIDFEGEETTCKRATALLKREEDFSDACSSAKENMDETCCYKLCDVCGETLMLDWDAVIEYEGDRIACGDLKPIFGRNEIEEGTDMCSDMKDSYRDFCCYTPPVEACNLCQTDTLFLDAYSSVEVNFWGSATNCSDVYDYLIRRIESESDICSSAKEAIFDQCCYKKCTVCGGNQLQDFEQSIELDGETISCQQLHTVRTTDVAKNSSTCQDMQAQFSGPCCYDAPDVPCVLCNEGSVRKELEVDFSGETETCEHVANFFANRASNVTEECTSSKAEFGPYCCFDKCSLCKEHEQIDWDGYVEFDGKKGVSCGSFDWYFTDNAIEEGTEDCTHLQGKFGSTCCYQQIDYSVSACSLCKQGDAWYDINGDIEVFFEGSEKTCTEVSNSLFRKFEDLSGFCLAAKTGKPAG
ncbi:hypothetical protein ACHAWF_018638, partial [Thalassiosira exigua]